MANCALYTGSRPLVGWFAAVGCLLALGCSTADTPEPGSGSSGAATSGGTGASSGAPGSSSGGTDFPHDTIDGIDIPRSLTLCGAIVPTVDDENITFDWSGAPSETTQYAVRLGKTAAGSDAPVNLVQKVQTETTIAVGERTSGVSYRLDAYALQDRTPLCTLGGANVVTPQ